MNERNQEEANISQANRLYDLKARELDQRAVELAESERECREAINLATAKYNAALARETKTKNELAKTQEQDDNFTEMSNHIFGDILTENPDVAQSAFGPHRVIRDRWKGMSPAQVNEIRKTQHDQMLEKQVSNRKVCVQLLCLIQLMVCTVHVIMSSCIHVSHKFCKPFITSEPRVENQT